MTNKELIEGLKQLASRMERDGDSYSKRIAENAIKALEQPKTELCDDCIRKQDEIRKAYDRGIENGLIPRGTCEDCISREKVLEQINCWIGSGEYGYTNATWYLNKRIKELPSVQPKAAWVPVSERLPEENEKYLVTQIAFGCKGVRIVYYGTRAKDYPCWYDFNSEYGYYEVYDIIAWMPLPEPYKEGCYDKR